MKKLKILLSIFLLLIFFLSATDSLIAKDYDTSIFWEITGNGLSQPSYLFGTVHMIGQSDFFLPDGLEDKFKSSGQVVLEVDMDEPDFMAKTKQLMFMPDNKSLDNLLEEKKYKVISQFFKDSLGLPLEQLKNLKPIFLTQFIIPKIINEPIASYEFTFLQMAKKNNIELIGLETIEEQINIFDKIPYENQAELILETITEFEEGKLLYSQLIEAYKKKNFNNLYELLFEISNELKEFEQLLLIERNKKWIPQIEKMIKDKPSFIAVGALHLEGENGLVAVLKSQGYKLKALN